VLDVVVPNRLQLRQSQAEMAKAREQTAAVGPWQFITCKVQWLIGLLDLEQYELHANGALSGQP
jgi:hypothetical protein